MEALVCYCPHTDACKNTHRRQYQCVCRARPWEHKTQITRAHCRGVNHAVAASKIQVCCCAGCRMKGQGKYEKAPGERPAKKPRTQSAPAAGDFSELLLGRFQAEFPSFISSLGPPPPPSLPPAAVSSLRAQLLDGAQRHIDDYIATLSPKAQPAWVRLKNLLIPLALSFEPAAPQEGPLKILRGAAGEQFALLGSHFQPCEELPSVRLSEVSVSPQEGMYTIPPFLTADIIQICVECQPPLYFLFQYTTQVDNHHQAGSDSDPHDIIDTFLSNMEDHNDGCCNTSHCRHDSCAEVFSSNAPDRHYLIAKSYAQSKRGRVLHLQEHFGASIPTLPRENDHACTHCIPRDVHHPYSWIDDDL